MLNKEAKGRLAEAVEKEADIRGSITGAGNDSHFTQMLSGCGPPLVNSTGAPWTAADIDTLGELPLTFAPTLPLMVSSSG